MLIVYQGRIMAYGTFKKCRIPQANGPCAPTWWRLV